MIVVTLAETSRRTRRISGKRFNKDVTLREYAVFVNNKPVGFVEQGVYSREVGPVQRRYVTARWDDVGWDGRTHGRLVTSDEPTRWRAVWEVLKAHFMPHGTEPEGLDRWELQDIAKEAKVVRP